MRLAWALVGGLLVTGVGCTNRPSNNRFQDAGLRLGVDGTACSRDNQCVEGLRCVAFRCGVEPDASVPVDAGNVDAAVAPDSAVTPDAAVVPDAAQPADAAVTPDASNTDGGTPDGATADDGGTTSDGGDLDASSGGMG